VDPSPSSTISTVADRKARRQSESSPRQQVIFTPGWQRRALLSTSDCVWLESGDKNPNALAPRPGKKFHNLILQQQVLGG
jgi:hypothetical protein